VTAPAYRPGQVAELLGVSVDTVRRLVTRGELKTHRTSGGQHVIDGVGLARYLQEHGAPHDEGAAVAQSARNRFQGIVTRVVKDKVMAQVEIHAGPHRIVSLISREAADELGLAPGVLAVAAVKSTNVVVEVPQ
jgi:molybdopterin-binding protein